MSKNDQLLKDLQDVADALSADGYRYPADFVDFAITELRRLEKIEAKYNAIMAQEKWTNPNDKAQGQYLPWIGEEVLFTHKGKTYYGKHTGGSFVSGYGFAKKEFVTWECKWMNLPKYE